MSKEVVRMSRKRGVKEQASVRTQGARRATGVVTDGAREVGPLRPGQRWSLARKQEVVLQAELGSRPADDEGVGPPGKSARDCHTAISTVWLAVP